MHKFSSAGLAMLFAGLLASVPAQGASAPKAGDACFKRVFDKTASTGRWLVKECVKETDMFFQVDFRDAKAQQFTSQFKVASDGMGDDNHNYTVVAGDTLVIDIMSERGGQVVFVHPVTDSKELSRLELPYTNPDEGGAFTLKRSGNTIALKTSTDDIAVAIAPDGRLSKTAKLQGKNK
jgi:hypothetical protein